MNCLPAREKLENIDPTLSLNVVKVLSIISFGHQLP